jgi:hypothetical protein
MHNQRHNQSQELSSFLMHRLNSAHTGRSEANGAASGLDERMVNELQKFLELERGRRGPSDETVAPVTKLLPQSGRFLRVVS